MFTFLKRGWCLALLIGIGVLIPIYQSFIFGVDINFNLFLRILLSLVVSACFYAIAYCFSMLMSKLSLALYSANIDNFLSILQVFLIASFFIFYWEAFALPDWKSYDSIFNTQLVLFATYYGVGFYCNERRFIPSFASRQNEIVEQKPSESIAQPLLTLIVVVVLLFGLKLHNIESLKSELYEKAKQELKVSQPVLDQFGFSPRLSAVVAGKVEGNYGRLRFNLTGQGITSIVEVEGKIVEGDWVITHLALVSPTKTLQLKAE